MLSLRPGVRIFISTEPTDMRKGFDGLQGIVSGVQACHSQAAGGMPYMVIPDCTSSSGSLLLKLPAWNKRIFG